MGKDGKEGGGAGAPEQGQSVELSQGAPWHDMGPVGTTSGPTSPLCPGCLGPGLGLPSQLRGLCQEALLLFPGSTVPTPRQKHCPVATKALQETRQQGGHLAQCPLSTSCFPPPQSHELGTMTTCI